MITVQINLSNTLFYSTLLSNCRAAVHYKLSTHKTVREAKLSYIKLRTKQYVASSDCGRRATPSPMRWDESSSISRHHQVSLQQALRCSAQSAPWWGRIYADISWRKGIPHNTRNNQDWSENVNHGPSPRYRTSCQHLWHFIKENLAVLVFV